MTTYSVLESDPSTPDYTSESASTRRPGRQDTRPPTARISTVPGRTGPHDHPRAGQGARLPDRQRHDCRADRCDAGGADGARNSRGCQGPFNMAACPQGPEVGRRQGFDRRAGGRPRRRRAPRRRKGPLRPGHPGRPAERRQDRPPDGAPNRATRSSAIAPSLLAAHPGRKLLGLFTGGNMSLEWSGPVGANPPVGPVRCTEDLRPANEPSLDEMTRKALDVLGSSHGSGRGFFLQVESASIDKQDHIAQAVRADRRDRELRPRRPGRARLREEAPDTLVIITGDHAHTSQTRRDRRDAGRLRDHPRD